MSDEKDLEIARLKGQVEALERVLTAMRAPPTAAVPLALPTTNPYPIGPYIDPVKLYGHGGMCACPQCCQRVYCETTTTTLVPDGFVAGGPFRPSVPPCAHP